jgi:hypothetical protein
LATELHDKTEDALTVMRLATQIVTDFLAEPEQQKAEPAVVLIGAANAPDPTVRGSGLLRVSTWLAILGKRLAAISVCFRACACACTGGISVILRDQIPLPG